MLNPSREIYVVVQVDGCLIQGDLAADWIVGKKEVGDVVIELKGRDVDHAVNQIEATFQFWISRGYRQTRLAGLIVCSRYPAIDSTLQRAKNSFAKRYAAPLHVVSRNLEFGFNALLQY